VRGRGVRWKRCMPRMQLDWEGYVEIMKRLVTVYDIG